jgi:hypothetical protein
LILRQASLGEDYERVSSELTNAFGEIRRAVLQERPVVLVLEDRDLLGQGSLADAALASGMLGLSRAFALEGSRSGWSVNALSHRGEDVGGLAAMLAASGLSGQLVRAGSEHLGRVWP